MSEADKTVEKHKRVGHKYRCEKCQKIYWTKDEAETCFDKDSSASEG